MNFLTSLIPMHFFPTLFAGLDQIRHRPVCSMNVIGKECQCCHFFCFHEFRGLCKVPMPNCSFFVVFEQKWNLPFWNVFQIYGSPNKINFWLKNCEIFHFFPYCFLFSNRKCLRRTLLSIQREECRRPISIVSFMEWESLFGTAVWMNSRSGSLAGAQWSSRSKIF